MRVLVVVILFCIASVYCKGLREEFTWTRLNYVFPRSSRSAFPKGSYSKGSYGGYGGSRPGTITFPQDTDKDTNTLQENVGDLYIYENNVPMGANRWQDKLFITVPRRRLGVPSTLNYVSLNSTEGHNVPLIPYPDIETNLLQPSRPGEGLVSVYRTAVDACDRLWMVDTGLLEIPGNRTQVQPPAIVIIDLHTNAIIKRYQLKPSDTTASSTLASLVIDVTPTTCDDAYAYIPDLSGYGLVVYSLQQDDSWRVTHNYFFVESQAGEFNVGGISFQWNDGVFSLGLSDLNADGFRTVYFHAMAGIHIYSVSTRILRDKELATRSYHGDDFKVEVNRGQGSQTSASDLHKPSGVLFLDLVNQNALGCWNTHKPAKPGNFDIIHKDNKKFIYPSDLKIYKDQVIVLTNTMPVFIYSNLNYDEVNFRVWMASIADAIKDTKCSS